MGKIIWDWTNHLGGESDNPRTGPDGAVNLLEGLDVRKAPGEVKLTKKLTDTGWILSSDIILLQDISHFGGSGVIVACEDGKIYLNGTLKHTLSTATSTHERVNAIGYMNVGGTDYLYYFSNTSYGLGKIHRSTMDLSTWDDEYKSFQTSSENEGVQVISEATRVVFGVGGRVFDIDSTGETITTKLTFSDVEEVVGLTVFQNTYRVYTNANNEDSRIYYWDGTSDDWDYKVIWENLPIRAVTNDTGYDYIIAGNSITSDLYLLAGTQKQEIRINTGSTGRQFGGYISINQGIVYISGEGKSGKDGIFTYGNFFPGYPKSLSLDYIIDISFMELHTHNKSSSYFSTGDDKVYQIGTTSGNLNTSGIIESLIFDGGKENAFIKKTIDYAYVGYGNTNTSDYLEIYAKSNGGIYKLLKTINTNDSSIRGVRIDRSEFQSIGLGDAFDLTYKVKFISDGVTDIYFRGIRTYITSGINK